MIRILSTDLHVLDMRTRMPFRYGVATLAALPHLLVRVEVEVDGRRSQGVSADGLPPKWFTKDPDSEFSDEVGDMLRVIETACDHARNIQSAPVRPPCSLKPMNEPPRRRRFFSRQWFRETSRHREPVHP